MTNSPPWVIRRAGPKDLDAAIRLSVSEGSRPARPVSKLEQETWRRMMTSPDLTVYLAVVGKEVIGTTTTMTMPNITYDCAPTLFIEAVRVAQAYRRQGIATAMIKQALADARAAGGNKVQLLSHKRHAHDGTHRFYGELGFQAEAEGFRLYLREAPVAL